MIINGGARSNWRFFAKHLMRADQNERIALTEIRGLAADNVRDALREMDALATGTRCKNFFYHANLNPRLGEHLTENQWEQAVDRLEHNLGLEGHSRFIVEHEKPDGRVHRHIIWSRIDPDSMTARSDSRNFAAHERTARELERLFGHERVQGVHAARRGAVRPERRPAGWETFRGQRSGFDPQDVKATLTALWQRADTGSAFRTALEDARYILCKGDRRDFVVVDPAGDDHSLARRIQGAKAADIRARMADIDPNGLPTVAEGRLLARTSDSSAAGAQPFGLKIASSLLPYRFDYGQVDRAERRAGDLPAFSMLEEGACYSEGYVAHGSGASGPEAPGRARYTHSDWQEEPAGARTGWKAEAPQNSGAARRSCPLGNAWRGFVDRTTFFADAAYGSVHTDSGDAAELVTRMDRFANRTATRAKAPRCNMGTWAAFIEEGATRDQAAGISWQERIRQQADREAHRGL